MCKLTAKQVWPWTNQEAPKPCVFFCHLVLKANRVLAELRSLYFVRHGLLHHNNYYEKPHNKALIVWGECCEDMFLIKSRFFCLSIKRQYYELVSFSVILILHFHISAGDPEIAPVRDDHPFLPTAIFSWMCVERGLPLLAALYSLGFTVNTLKGQCGQMAFSQNTRQFSLAVTRQNLSPPDSAENRNPQKLSGGTTSHAF